MSFKNIIILLLCLVSNTIFAQNIKGSIKSITGESVAFANITVLNNAVGTVADKEGNFALTLDKGKYQIQFSAVGYANKIQQIEVTDQALTVDITLTNNTQTLGEVVVTA